MHARSYVHVIITLQIADSSSVNTRTRTLASSHRTCSSNAQSAAGGYTHAHDPCGLQCMVDMIRASCVRGQHHRARGPPAVCVRSAPTSKAGGGRPLQRSAFPYLIWLPEPCRASLVWRGHLELPSKNSSLRFLVATAALLLLSSTSASASTW